MILINNAANTLNGDLHSVPTVHLPNTNLAAIQTYAQTAGATATLSPVPGATVDAPQIASFSSRGPSAATFDQLKPDVSAPGVDVLAGYSPASLVQPGFLFNMVSGTSMSSPHVAGLGALLTHKHPTWTPAMIKSSLMTTANDLHGTFNATAGPPTQPGTAAASADANRAFAQGAGHVRPTLAVDPGLVYDNNSVDWLRFICGTGQLPASECAPFGGPIDPSDLNLASITIGDMAGAQTVTRTVRSVGSSPETYSVEFSGLPGITASVDTPIFELDPGESQDLNITFTRTDAAFNVYQSGFMTLTGSEGHEVRSPVTIRPVLFSAPLEVTSTGTSASWQVKPGYSGALNATLRGLAPATETTFTVLQDPNSSFNRLDPKNFRKDIVIPGNATLRVALFDEEMVTPSTDLDLYVTQGATTIASSGGPTSTEVITVRNTTAGPLSVTAYVHGFATNGPSATGTLFDWVVATADPGTTLAGVGPAVAGVLQTHTVSSSSLTPGTRYLARVDYDNGPTVLARTLVSINP